MRKIYLLGAVLGFIIPYAFFIPFLLEHGLDVGRIVEQMFANPIASFFVVDVIVTSLVLWVFIFAEGRKLGMSHLWTYILCNLLVGASLALPLFLYFREGRLEEKAAAPAT